MTKIHGFESQGSHLGVGIQSQNYVNRIFPGPRARIEATSGWFNRFDCNLKAGVEKKWTGTLEKKVDRHFGKRIQRSNG